MQQKSANVTSELEDEEKQLPEGIEQVGHGGSSRVVQLAHLSQVGGLL
jgi:hypothetical protein